MRIARFTTGDDPAYGLVDGAGEKIAEITGDPLYLRIELTGTVHDVADVSTASRSTVTTPVMVPALGGAVPTNVATICAWTWMCRLGDIHADDAGYAVMTGVVAARL